MKPVNNKSLLHFIFDQMEKLDNKEIDNDTAKAQAALAKQANNALMYEIVRSATKAKLEVHNREYGSTLELREAEIKNFE